VDTSNRKRLLFGTSAFCGVLVMAVATGAMAQVTPAPAAATSTEVEGVVVTGSRIVRQDYVANSPIQTVTGAQVVQNNDITIESFLNTLPEVNPAATSTSNNPPNNGQANIDLRGLGANRNLVLIDGRRTMVSARDLTVDVNTIPQALIDSVEVITGGAGATYGADAIAGAVNIKLKKRFEGIDLRASYGNTPKLWDAETYQLSAVMGANFADDRGNAVIAFDRSYRQAMYKNQRSFSVYGSSTTSFYPDGLLFWTNPSSTVVNNPVSQTAINTLFAQSSYGSNAPITRSSGTIGFNADGSLFYRGVFNDPRDIQNLRKPATDPTVNQKFYPDLYMYNFDYVNILTLPLDRRSFMAKMNYELPSDIEVFGQFGWTNYTAADALAPTPVPTISVTPAIAPGLVISGTFSQLAVPVTNPFIPNDLKTLLNSRTGDTPGLAGAGATEPFLIRTRTLDTGLRQENFENNVTQYMAGVRGPIGSTGWRFETYLAEGRTKIINTQTGNVDTKRLEELLTAADGGASICSGGFNPFGIHPLSTECQNYLRVDLSPTTDLLQDTAQAYVSGDWLQLPAGKVSWVAGAEYRYFKYDFNPGPGASTISGFTTGVPEAGKNSFNDQFGEVLIPIVKDSPWAQSLDVNIGVRRSVSEFTNNIDGTNRKLDPSWAYKAELNWKPIDYLRFRGSYQRAVRAPNFNELFVSGSDAPQYFDPCTHTTNFRTNVTGSGALCAATGVGDVAGFVQTPGSQLTSYNAGNPDLNPEKADTYTLGMVFSIPGDNQWTSRFRGSLDYYRIKVKDAILRPNANAIVADCFNYYGNNKALTDTYVACSTLAGGRAGAELLQLDNPYPGGKNDVENGAIDFVYSNAGQIDTSGVDLTLDYGWDNSWFGLGEKWGSVTAKLIVSRLIDYKSTALQQIPKLDYAGTVAYFGAGFGQSFPLWRLTGVADWDLGKFDFNLRGRFIDKMRNRLEVEFPGEHFTGTPDVWYLEIY
jgi:iron complex outermembrane receptor protein